jgi:FtsZ-binding cell division protein ZapB
LTKCPECGAEVSSPVKSWPVSFKKPGEADTQPQFCVGIFECPNCKSKFRTRVAAESSVPPTPASNVADLVVRINSIREGLAQSLKTLQLKIKTLETERSSLLTEVGELKRTAELRVAALEVEVGQLREETKAMRELLRSDANENS